MNTTAFHEIKTGQTFTIKGAGRRAKAQTFTAASDAIKDQFCANGTTYKVLIEGGEAYRLANGADLVQVAA
jgi:hypothetical protein